MFVTVKADLSLAVGEDAVARDDLGGALAAATGGDRNQRVFLRADNAVPYGGLLAVVNGWRHAGYLKVGLVGLAEGEER